MQPLLCSFYLFHAVYDSTLDSVPLSIPPSQLTPSTHPFILSMEWVCDMKWFGDETREKCEDEEIDFGMGERDSIPWLSIPGHALFYLFSVWFDCLYVWKARGTFKSWRSWRCRIALAGELFYCILWCYTAGRSSNLLFEGVGWASRWSLFVCEEFYLEREMGRKHSFRTAFVYSVLLNKQTNKQTCLLNHGRLPLRVVTLPMLYA